MVAVVLGSVYGTLNGSRTFDSINKTILQHPRSNYQNNVWRCRLVQDWKRFIAGLNNMSISIPSTCSGNFDELLFRLLRNWKTNWSKEH